MQDLINWFTGPQFESTTTISTLTVLYLISIRGFQIPIVPSTRPPATSPSENSSEPDVGDFPQDNRLNGSEMGIAPTKGSLRSSDWKSSWKISRFADELNDMSTAPAIVPAAINGASGAKATDADLFTSFMQADVSILIWFDLIIDPIN